MTIMVGCRRDAAAFLIEADGQRLFYTGDFRGHGRKRLLLERLRENPVSNIDCLVMEGSMIGRDEGRYPDEMAVEQAIYDVIAKPFVKTFRSLFIPVHLSQASGCLE